MKRVFDFVKVRYRGLAKNACRLSAACALANLFIVNAPAAAPGPSMSSMKRARRRPLRRGPQPQAAGAKRP